MGQMSKVCKFGGTSLAAEIGFSAAAEIIKRDKSRKFIVVSAQGKRFVTDIKVTDLLILLCDSLERGKNTEAIFREIKNRHFVLREKLCINLDLEREFGIITENFKLGREYIVSRGEYLNAKMFSAYTGLTFCDAREYFLFKGKIPDRRETLKLLEDIPENSVLAGFYGRDETSGEIRLFSRGGSDISGALLALSKNAVYENFTDTCGILSADPKIIAEAERIEKLTYDNVKTLSSLGADVIHKSVSQILKGSGLPLIISNTFCAESGSTLVSDYVYTAESKRLAVLVDKNCVSVVYIGKINLIKQAEKLIKAASTAEIPYKSVKINFAENYISFKTSKKYVKKLALIFYRSTEEIKKTADVNRPPKLS